MNARIAFNCSKIMSQRKEHTTKIYDEPEHVYTNILTKQAINVVDFTGDQFNYWPVQLRQITDN